MSALVPIGEFSRLTHLTVKTLRHYHEVIAAHLDRMEAELTKTQSIVSSLRSFLINPRAGIQVGYRTIDPVPALSVSAVVPRLDIDTWCESAFSELYGRLGSNRLVPIRAGRGDILRRVLHRGHRHGHRVPAGDQHPSAP